MHAIQLAKTDPALDYELTADVIQWSVRACENCKATDISDAILSLVSSLILCTVSFQLSFVKGCLWEFMHLISFFDTQRC